MNKNHLYLFFILFCITVCFSFSLGMFFTEQPKPRANEILTPKPAMILPDGSVNKEYLKNVTDYTADHFAFRTDLITIHNAILSKVFHTSASDDVILGKQNWLFYKQTENDYIGKNILSDNDIESIAHTLHMIQQYVENQNAKFLFVIAPNKNSLYGEYMPDSMYTIRNESNAQHLMNALQKQNVNYIDLFRVFRQKNEVLYYQLDSHWNNKGASLAYHSIMNALGICMKCCIQKGNSWKMILCLKSNLIFSQIMKYTLLMIYRLIHQIIKNNILCFYFEILSVIICILFLPMVLGIVDFQEKCLI